MDLVEKLPSDIKTIWRLKALIDFVILVVIAGALLVWRILGPKSMEKPLLMAISIVSVVAILVLVVELMLVNYHWNYWTYYVDERQVELHHGFFFRKQIIIPIARVQNVTLKQGPILRLKKLQKVIVETAAGGSEIDGLKDNQADEIKELIMKLAREARNDI